MTREELKKWRLKNGLTQAGLGAIIDRHWVTINKWERGRGKIPHWVSALLAFAECQEMLRKGSYTAIVAASKEAKK